MMLTLTQDATTAIRDLVSSAPLPEGGDSASPRAATTTVAPASHAEGSGRLEVAAVEVPGG